MLSLSTRIHLHLAEHLTHTALDPQARGATKARIFNLYLACFTQEEIAERLEISQQLVTKTLPQMAEWPNVVNLQAEHRVDFKVPIYNVWKDQKNKTTAEHFGNTHHDARRTLTRGEQPAVGCVYP